MHSANPSIEPRPEINRQGRPARDTHALPPDHICEAYWKYNKVKPADLDSDPDVVDFGRGLSARQADKIHPVKTISSETIAAASVAFKYHGEQGLDGPAACSGDGGLSLSLAPEPCTVYEHDDFPGLQIYPSLLPPEIQLLLLSRIMHRDLSNPHHKTNINTDYNVPYPAKTSRQQAPTEAEQDDASSSSSADHPSSNHPSDHASFFTLPGQSGASNLLTPRTPSSTSTSTSSSPTNPKPLKPLNISQYLLKKLRWLTLGQQYDWPTRSYSGADSTSFPADIASLVGALFPFLRSESGVVLLYSAKDYMPVHRDVSEQCERGLASFSLGCDGLFVIAKDTTAAAGKQEEEEEEEEEEEAQADGKNAKEAEPEHPPVVVLRVKSGDVVVMDGETRWAWHAMPKVVGGTCPEFMRAWPAGSAEPKTRGRVAGDEEMEKEDEKKEEENKAYERWRGFMVNRRLNISCRQVFD